MAQACGYVKSGERRPPAGGINPLDRMTRAKGEQFGSRMPNVTLRLRRKHVIQGLTGYVRTMYFVTQSAQPLEDE
jgi:hypothetical protein